MREKGEANILKGMLAGAVGGLVASWTMNEFQKAWAAAEKQITAGKRGQQGGQQNGEDAEDATMKTAVRVGARSPPDARGEEKGRPGGALRVRRAHGSSLRRVRGSQSCRECVGGHSIWRDFICRSG